MRPLPRAKARLAAPPLRAALASRASAPFPAGAMLVVFALLLAATHLFSVSSVAADFLLVDTGQETCYDDSDVIDCPDPGADFHGQDAQYDGNLPSYSLSEDGLTVYDAHTALRWVRTPDTNGDGDLDSGDKLTWEDALAFPTILNAENFGGYDDWRVPGIKELYSLIDFGGIDPSGYGGDTTGLTPFIDRHYFDFVYGDENAGERPIDAQYWSSTEYVGLTMGGDSTTFGVNFADGRIKGYGRTNPMGGQMRQFLRCVRGNPSYGISSFLDNGDGTVTDTATALMWMRGDSGEGMIWEDALAYAENLTYGDYDDWRLPNAKELQSIVDYTRSPSTTGSAAIDPVFTCTPIIDEGGDTNYPFYWSSTTHANWTEVPGRWGVYVAFGEALGWMREPFPPYNYRLMDVHGAGAQRSDPKSGDPDDWPYGNGPQGDVVRIYNYVRCVRDAGDAAGGEDEETSAVPPLRFRPNPFASRAELVLPLPPGSGLTDCIIYDPAGRAVRKLVPRGSGGGESSLVWDGTNWAGERVSAGIYYASVAAGGERFRCRLVALR